MPSTDPGERIYAIGDVHGRYDLLKLLLDAIGEHSGARATPEALHIVFLGDLVDRGPDSARVVDLVAELESDTDQVIALMGNHEEAMLRALDGDLMILRKWLQVGGADTVRSYGLELPDEGADMRRYLRRLKKSIPSQHARWMRSMPLTARSGDYFFCHAGIRPGVPLHRQSRDDLLWIRKDFLDADDDFGAVIVHGHTIAPEVVSRRNRIGIDTGAYASGKLTALYLEDDRQEVITVDRAGRVSTQRSKITAS
ncbi:metallophosphoesterase family protein [Novosphingobium soli]|uniref:Metallophosphoesterase family protein n=1 Tax=Novosphingobium soli TaxID=574956 RepID=A0ABV6CWH3_9SPHN